MGDATWKGGTIRRDKKGRQVFIIERQVAGQRYHVSTRAHTVSAALKHLERFEEAPEHYDPRGGLSAQPLILDVDMVRAFLKYSKHEKKNSREWLGKQKRVLDWWSKKLKARDLRHLNLAADVLAPLQRASSRTHRISILKGFFTWLRTVEHRIATAEDPVYGQLTVPQSRPAQWKKTKVVPRDHFELVRAHLVGPYRDALTVQGGTGWHTTEICRFAEAGTIEPVPPSDTGSAAVLICPLRKSGEPQRTRVSAEALLAAQRLLKHGAVSREWYDRAVEAACGAVKRPDGGIGIPKWKPGRLRHSVATWALDAGADPAAVAAFLGHKSPRTTRKFYAVHASPARVPALI